MCRPGFLLVYFPTVNISGATLAYLSAATISATTFYSGATNLNTIINQAVTAATSSLTSVAIQNGLNTYTGGTAALPTVNISAATLSYLSATTISAGTIYSGSTNLNTIINTAISNATNSLTSTRVQNGTNTFTGGTADLPTVNVTGGTVNNWNINGGILASGGTDLYSIFVTALDGNDITRVQPGSNILTAGTGNNPIISVVDSPSLNNLTLSGNSIAVNVSATTFYSAGTNLQTVITSLLDGNDITRVAGGLNTYTGGTANVPTVNISAATLVYLSATTISADTIYSGSTPLQTIITNMLDGNDITRVQPGLNIYTGGTPNNPTVNISAATLTYLSASTVAGDVLLSGSTNLYSIFATSSGADTFVQNGTNTYTGGTLYAPTVNVSAATLFALTVTGNTVLSATTATTLNILNSGYTNINIVDYSLNTIRTGVTVSNIIGGTGNTINNDLRNVQILGGNNITGTNNHHSYATNLVVTGTSNGNLYATNIFSGSTPLQTIIQNLASADGNDITRVAGGTNTYTGGTGNIPTVNISAATLATLTVSGLTALNTMSAVTVSATTLYSGSTNVGSIFESKITPGNYINKSGATTIWLSGSPCDFALAISDETTAITTGNGKLTFYAPYDFVISNVYASLSTSGSTNSAFNVKLTGTTIFSNASGVVVDLNTQHSINSTFASTITATTVPAFSKISIDIMSAGTAAVGAKLYIVGTRTL